MAPPVAPRQPDDLPDDVQSQLLQIIDRDLALPEREAAVDSLCAAHPDVASGIRREFEDMLHAADSAPTTASSGIPDAIGPYRVLALLGRGGMGEVYKAERREPVRQVVAIKVVKQGLATKEVLARFALERRALAAMNHRCIARIFDAGATERGEPYFVMELVEGLPLTRYCDEHRMSVPDRLRLFQLVCQGVQHAHQKGIVHRDLKPGNVMVVREGDDAAPKILDFGLAKATNREFGEESLLSQSGQVMGTPEYMSPEQAAGNGELIDARSDIYSLGVMLYEVLTGELPFPSEVLRRAGALDALRMIREEDPPKPSTRLTTRADSAVAIAAQQRTTVPALSKALRGDLDWVVMRAMAKEPERRYDSAAGLAHDIERFLNFEPVLAGPPSAAYRLRKFARRYRTQLIGAAGVVLALIAGLVASLVFYRNAVEARNDAKANERVAIERAGQIEEQRDTIQRSAAALGRRNEEFDLLANVVHLRTARAHAAALFPAWPEQLPGLERWLASDARRLRDALPKLRETVRALDERQTGEADGAGDPPVLAEEADRFLFETLGQLLRDIEAFCADAVVDVEQRRDWATRIGALTEAHPNARVSWNDARAAIGASDEYALQPLTDLRPQTGLVPIGMNPATGLFEFYHLRSAWDGQRDPAGIEIPVHDARGGIAVAEDTGIVFVLIPGRTFTMGAQKRDSGQPDFDLLAQGDEIPHQVTLDPFLLARHELTQGQWLRLATGDLERRPSRYAPGFSAPGVDTPVDLSHPVESVDWTMCDTLLRRYGLGLPTEAQWEFGCRAGSSEPWSCGLDPAALQRAANVFDARAKRFSPWPGQATRLDDGFLVHAPVGSLEPNAFGLFDAHGNVLEWTADWYGPYSLPSRRTDGLRSVEPGKSSNRVCRGGSFHEELSNARSAYRDFKAPGFQDDNLGVRAARRVER